MSQPFEMEKTFAPQQVEEGIYRHWEESGAFKPNMNSEKAPYTIVMPPPNITGQLHMGHAMDATIQDVLTRFHRMLGQPTLWLPGTDHASIATQNKVEQLLAQKNLTKYDLGREDFLKEVDKYVKNSQSTIRNQSPHSTLYPPLWCCIFTTR